MLPAARLSAVCILLFPAMILAVAGCATGYHERGFSGGYENSRLQNNIHQVRFYGNGYTGRNRSTDFTLLRAADVTLLEGFPYFIILEQATHVDTSIHSSPPVVRTTGNVDLYGSVSTSTVVSGGGTYSISKPSSNMLIECLKEQPASCNGIIYDAKQVQENLRASYRIQVEPETPAADATPSRRKLADIVKSVVKKSRLRKTRPSLLRAFFTTSRPNNDFAVKAHAIVVGSDLSDIEKLRLLAALSADQAADTENSDEKDAFMRLNADFLSEAKLLEDAAVDEGAEEVGTQIGAS